MNISTQNIVVKHLNEQFDLKINPLSIKNINEIRKEQDYNSFLKNLSLDKKFKIISEENENKNSKQNDIRFQEGVPVANTIESSKIFNETRKVFNKKSRQYNFKQYYEVEPEKIFESKNEKGFYIIIDGMLIEPDSRKEELSYIQKRINKIYNIKKAKDPGTLVNVIA